MKSLVTQEDCDISIRLQNGMEELSAFRFFKNPKCIKYNMRGKSSPWHSSRDEHKIFSSSSDGGENVRHVFAVKEGAELSIKQMTQFFIFPEASVSAQHFGG